MFVYRFFSPNCNCRVWHLWIIQSCQPQKRKVARYLNYPWKASRTRFAKFLSLQRKEICYDSQSWISIIQISLELNETSLVRYSHCIRSRSASKLVESLVRKRHELCFAMVNKYPSIHFSFNSLLEYNTLEAAIDMRRKQRQIPRL